MSLPRTYEQWHRHTEEGLRAIDMAVIDRILNGPAYLVDDIDRYVSYWVKCIDSRRQRDRTVEKIRQLREGTTGRTDAEIQTAKRLADNLEAKLSNGAS